MAARVVEKFRGSRPHKLGCIITLLRFIGAADLSKIEKPQSAKIGPTPTSFEGMRLAMGNPVEVDCWRMGKTGPHKNGRAKVDPKGKKAWLEAEMEQWGWKRDPKWELGVSSIPGMKCPGPRLTHAPITEMHMGPAQRVGRNIG